MPTTSPAAMASPTTLTAGKAPAPVTTAPPTYQRISRLAIPARAKLSTMLAAQAIMMASVCPANTRARLGPCNSDVLMVPRPQSPPAMTAPSTMNGAVKETSLTAWMANWLGRRAGRFCAGVPNCAYVAGVSPR